MNYPDERFVRLRLADKKHKQYMTFVQSTEKDARPEDNPIIQKIREEDPKKADKFTLLLSIMKNNEDAFYDWLEASEENAFLFLNNPIEAIKIVFPDAPTDL